VTFARTTSLRRTSSLARTAMPPRKKRVNAKSARRDDELAVLAASREIVRARSGGLCEIQVPGKCHTWADEGPHHIEGRGMGGGGDHSPENLLDCCQPCHDHAHLNRAEAEAAGWIRRRNR
jgi:hypothetical protein